MLDKRRSGILLHITSLPSRFGIGDLGHSAYRFADFLSSAGQTLWQVLPLNPTDGATSHSPYSSTSAYAGNPLLISPELLYEDGLLRKEELEPDSEFPQSKVDYERVVSFKWRLLDLAYERFSKSSGSEEFEKFCQENASWLNDFALFSAIKHYLGGKPWNQWDQALRDRERGSLKTFSAIHAKEIEKEKFVQYLFFKQWFALKGYCSQRNINIVGDVPIYVSYDSADVWAHPEIFKLREDKSPEFVAGVPPDYFSQTGQLWGNPVYRWETLLATGFEWWLQRMEHYSRLFDIVRLDHFRGFVAYWEVDSKEQTAVRGKWVQVPCREFFTTLSSRLPHLQIIAEDLGMITEDVKEIMREFDFPGMKVLLFAFGSDLPTNPYAPHNHIENCVVYTGTHDNNTVRGWFENEATPEDRQRLFRYIGRQVDANEVYWVFVRMAMMSVANTVIIPMQDVLGLGADSRMNLPSTSEGNWRWRLTPQAINDDVIARLRDVTEVYGRLHPSG